MILNFFKTAWRSIVNNKAYSVLNISGLAIGMAIALLIGLWVHYQFSFNKFLPGNEHIYKAGKSYIENGSREVVLVTPMPLAEAIKRDVPGVKYVTVTDWLRQHGLQSGDKKLYLNGAMAGEDFLNVFRYPLISGDRNTVLADPYSIVLDESTARALFNTTEVVGKTVKIDNQHNLLVTGVMKDVPSNSTLQFSYVVPMEYKVLIDKWTNLAKTNWDQTTSQVYVALESNVSYDQVKPALAGLFKKYSPDEYSRSKTETMLHPMSEWHLYSEFINGVAKGGFIEYVKLFGTIGLFVLVIACINFVNLSTARSGKRAREVGVRKAIGSSRSQLIIQFLAEAVLMSAISCIMALILVQFSIPLFKILTGAELSLPMRNPSFWALMAGYIFLTGLMAGAKPAFYISSFRTVKVLKGISSPGKASSLPRKTLVVLQFTCSIALIISTVIVYQQVRHAQGRPTGFDPSSSLLMTDASSDIKKNYQALKQDLLSTGIVSSVTKSSSPVTDNWSFNGIDQWPGKQDDKALSIATIGVTDADYFKTMGMTLVKGRNFEGAGDSLNVIINEAAAEQMHLSEPLNQLITWDTHTRARIIGVAKNAITGSPFGDARPTLFAYNPEWANFVSYRLSPGVNTQTALQKLATVFAVHNPGLPFMYKFADEQYASKFQFEVMVGRLAGVFAALAIFISCLGLFGLAAFTAEQRTKEIGIRKVLGASVQQLWLLLSKEFLLPVLISAAIATPIAIYFLQDWLAKYSYRIEISPLVFVIVTAGSLAVALFTVSLQSIKSSMVNPIKSLKERQ